MAIPQAGRPVACFDAEVTITNAGAWTMAIVTAEEGRVRSQDPFREAVHPWKAHSGV